MCVCGFPLTLGVQGAIAVLIDVLMSVDKRTSSTYHQLVMCTAFYSLWVGIGWMLGTNLNPSSSGQYQAVGNESTCVLQGYLLQFGQGVVYYHGILQMYFWYRLWPTVQPSDPHGRRPLQHLSKEVRDVLEEAEAEEQAQQQQQQNQQQQEQYRQSVIAPLDDDNDTEWIRWRRSSHFWCFVLAAGLASGAIPYYNVSITVCTVAPPPINANYGPLAGFVMTPIAIVVVYVLVTAYRLSGVHQIHRSDPNAEEELLRLYGQSKWYVTSFMTVWSGGIFGIFLPLNRDTWWILILGSTIPSLSGLLNALVYFWFEKREGGMPNGGGGGGGNGGGGKPHPQGFHKVQQQMRNGEDPSTDFLSTSSPSLSRHNSNDSILLDDTILSHEESPDARFLQRWRQRNAASGDTAYFG